jgi:hypothetical protein
MWTSTNRCSPSWKASLLRVVWFRLARAWAKFCGVIFHAQRVPDRTLAKIGHSSQLNEEIESTNILWKPHSAGSARKLECGETMEPAINPVSMICGTPLQSIASPLGTAETKMCNDSCPNYPFTLGTFIWRPPRFISP